MARKKQDIPDESKKTPEYTAKELHSSDLSDLAADWANEEERLAKGEPEPKVEEPKEEPKEEVVEEPKPEVKEPEKPLIDEEKLTSSIANRLIEQLAPENATREEKKDLKEKLKDLQDKAKAEEREITYTEALEFLQSETKETVKSELKDELREELKKDVLADLQKEVETEEAKQKADADAVKQRQEQWKNEWDRQLTGLEESGLLPKLLDPKDANDPRVKEEMALFAQLKEYNEKNPKAPILNLFEFHTRHYKSPNEKPPGANAPVSGARRSVTPSNPNEFSYSEIHNSSLEDLAYGK